VNADRRVDEARAYVDQARPRHDVLLPASVLTRMFYDLPRHTIGLLAVVDEHDILAPAGNIDLTQEQLDTVRQALADAARWQGSRIGRCRRCKPGRVCSEHQDAVPLVAAYHSLSRALGGAQ
jgi:hypothetical protein